MSIEYVAIQYCLSAGNICFTMRNIVMACSVTVVLFLLLACKCHDRGVQPRLDPRSHGALRN